VQLHGTSVVLRSWHTDDARAVAEACSDPEIPRWIPFVPTPYTEEDAVAYVRGCIDAGESRHPFAVVDADSGMFYGSIDMTINSMRTGQIGYWIARGARGRGVCTEALRELCRYAFDDLGLERLELMTDPDNAGSQRVADKVGFSREGVLRSHLVHHDGQRRDSVLFSLLPGELV